MKTTWTLGSAMLSIVLASGGAVLAQGSAGKGEITVTGCLQPAGANNALVGTSGSSPSRPADTARAGSADAASAGFVLMNAKMGGAPGGGSGVATVAPAGSGTTQSAVQAGTTQPSPALTGAIGPNGEPNGADSRMYVLRGNNPELPRHVGQEVEISGRVIGSAAAASAPGAAATSTTTSGSASTTSSASSSTTTAGTAGMAHAASGQELEVTTIRMIASVCAAK